jgi:hypothetical protein
MTAVSPVVYDGRRAPRTPFTVLFDELGVLGDGFRLFDAGETRMPLSGALVAVDKAALIAYTAHDILVHLGRIRRWDKRTAAWAGVTLSGSSGTRRLAGNKRAKLVSIDEILGNSGNLRGKVRVDQHESYWRDKVWLVVALAVGLASRTRVERRVPVTKDLEDASGAVAVVAAKGDSVHVVLLVIFFADLTSDAGYFASRRLLLLERKHYSYLQRACFFVYVSVSVFHQIDTCSRRYSGASCALGCFGSDDDISI